VSYADMVKLAGGTPIFIKGGLEQDFKASVQQLEQAITEKTKIVIYSSPSNPTGSVFTLDELKDIAKVLSARKDIFVIADEIYEYINFTGKHHSMASFSEMAENTITVNGFSKGHAMTGWRVGYICAPVWIAKAAEKLQGQMTSGNSSIAQRAAYAATIGDMQPTKDMAAQYLKRRDIVLELLNQIPGVKTSTPTGAFYVFPDISAYFGKKDGDTVINTAEDFSMYILNKAHVSLVTGDAFGAPECVRISFAASEEQLREALKRMKEAMLKLY
ncbi:MAG: aminotransferase class I/II-fold pyridoxal phosphate-dependent enzyme, partial [Bacteroidota bacterium]|nr:aminotransferase class I/II-fold pyridoxal phosphate-dependent enzyme [Bacteroidota bacterium]MDQ3535035.1 aminotransferase class I/II-fold pyridoxal phosphate-dependent enzyme [Bacteroidota bacterium]